MKPGDCILLLLLCLNICIDGSTSTMRIVCRFDGDISSLGNAPYLCSHILFETSYLLNTTDNDCNNLRFSHQKDNTDLKQNREYKKIMKLTNGSSQLKVMLSMKVESIMEFLSANSECKNSSKTIRNDVEMFADVFVESIQYYKFTGLDINNWLKIIHNKPTVKTNMYTDAVIMIQQTLRRNGQLFSITTSDDTNNIGIIFNPTTVVHFVDFMTRF